MAVISISDSVNYPNVLSKFKNSTQMITGYPAVNQGKTGNAILVNGRFQVKVLSRDSSFTESDRKDLLKKFDLNGLSRLK